MSIINSSFSKRFPNIKSIKAMVVEKNYDSDDSTKNNAWTFDETNIVDEINCLDKNCKDGCIHLFRIIDKIQSNKATFIKDITKCINNGKHGSMCMTYFEYSIQIEYLEDK